MLNLKIDDKCASRIVDAIKAEQGDASVNLLSISKVVELAKHAEKQLVAIGLPIKYRTGAKLEYCPSGPAARAYKYGQGATRIRIARKSTGWYVEEINRIKVYPKQIEALQLMLTPEQKDVAVRQFCRSFEVMNSCN